MFNWGTKKEKVMRGAWISAKSKLEGIRQMNELTDKISTSRQKALRQKLRDKF